jgi:hypothetical protein
MLISAAISQNGMKIFAAITIDSAPPSNRDPANANSPSRTIPPTMIMRVRIHLPIVDRARAFRK